jgi:hypothetical protein
MEELVRFWQAGGPWMWLIALLGLLGQTVSLVLGLLVLLWRRRPTRFPVIACAVLCALGLLIVAVGFAGHRAGLAQVEAVLAMVNADDRETIRAAGHSEARAPLIFGTLAGLPPLFMGIALLGLAVSRLPRYAPRAPVGAERPAPGGAPTPLVLSTVIAAGAVLVFGLTLAGWQRALATAEEAIANVNPSDRATLLAYSQEEARDITTFGLAVGVPLLLVGGALFGVGRSRLPRADPPAAR